MNNNEEALRDVHQKPLVRTPPVVPADGERIEAEARIESEAAEREIDDE